MDITPTTGPLSGLAMGRMGGVIIADANAHTGLNCGALQVIGAAVISSITLKSNWVGSLNGATLAAGTLLRIQFTAITLTSGSVIAYND